MLLSSASTMSADNARPRLNTAQQVARRVHQTLGFQKGYNFVLCWFFTYCSQDAAY